MVLARHAGPAALLQGLAQSLGLGPALGNLDGGSLQWLRWSLAVCPALGATGAQISFNCAGLPW